jgi:GGDEF domain-containing protein
MNALTDPADWPVADPAAAALHAAQAQLFEAMAGQQGWMWTLKDASDGRCLRANDAWAAFIGRPLSELPGHTDAELLEPALAALLRTADQTALAHRGLLTSEHRVDMRGERRDWTVMRLVLQQGDRRVLCSVWQDPTVQRQRDAALKAALEQLEQQQKANVALRREMGDTSLRDQATGLSSSAHFEDQMRREVDLSMREHREFALVYMELDPPGEKAQAFGERALERVHEAMGRLSGVGLATAHSRMEGLRRQCATQIIALDGQELGFTVSVGVASFPHTAQTQEGVIAACEAALAQARHRGGNAVALASIRFGPA